MGEIVKSPHYERWTIEFSVNEQIELGLTKPDLYYFGRKSYDARFKDDIEYWLGENIRGDRRYDKLYDLAVYAAQAWASVTFWTARDAVLFKEVVLAMIIDPNPRCYGEIKTEPHFKRQPNNVAWRIDLSDNQQISLGIADGALSYICYPADQYHPTPYHRCRDEVDDWLRNNIRGSASQHLPYALEVYPASGHSQFIFWTERDAVLFKLFWL